MTYGEFVKAVQAKTGEAVSQKAVKEVVDAATDVLMEAMIAGDAVSLHGFGTFRTVDVAPRKGHNPATGETIEIGATRRITFKASKGLRDAVKPS